VSGAENGAERAETRLERSGRSWERAGKICRSNPLYHKITQSKKFKIEFKSYHKTFSVSLLLPLLCRE